VTLINTHVDDNLGKGLNIFTEGTVTLNGVTAMRNASFGASIYNLASGNVVINSNSVVQSEFGRNVSSYGLQIQTSGTVSITNVSAYENGGYGIDIIGGSNIIVRNTSSTQVSWICDNQLTGLNIESAQGHVLLSGRIFINHNGWYGAVINNTSTPLMNVTINGITANNNNQSNIRVLSKGNISLSNVTADENDWNRADLTVWTGVELINAIGTGAGNVTISGSNVFSNSSHNGLQVTTTGTVNITGVLAEGNLFNGIYVLDTGSSDKTITLRNITARNNGRYGGFADANGVVRLTNVNSYLNGMMGDFAGIYVYAGGNFIYFTNCVAISNTGSGIYVLGTPASMVYLVNSLYFGNDTNNNGDPDLQYV
jgi:hypothetical protein